MIISMMTIDFIKLPATRATAASISQPSQPHSPTPTTDHIKYEIGNDEVMGYRIRIQRCPCLLIFGGTAINSAMERPKKESIWNLELCPV